jgi:uncharacterized protein
MQPGSKRILVLITGWSFILLGIVGLFLPFLQGLLFLVIGIIILSSQYAWARLLMAKLRKRFPALVRLADHAVVKAKTFLKCFSHRRSTS